jgi:hypothetical protein
MRHFVAESIHHLRGQTVGGIPLFEAQMITRLFLHSDNAAQHFKSSKSLHWLSKQMKDMGFVSVMWDFGPPPWARQGPSVTPLLQEQPD